MRYPILIDGEDGVYGVVFPDLPGCVAMGHTLDEAMVNAEDALQDWMDSMEELGYEIPDPSPLEAVDRSCRQHLVHGPAGSPSSRSRSVRLNLVVDAGVATVINSEARRRGNDPQELRRVDGQAHRSDGRIVDCIQRINDFVERSSTGTAKPSWGSADRQEVDAIAAAVDGLGMNVWKPHPWPYPKKPCLPSTITFFPPPSWETKEVENATSVKVRHCCPTDRGSHILYDVRRGFPF